MDRQRPYLETARPSTLAELEAALRAAPPRAGRTRVLAIDGRSGAGKSTLARALAERLGDAPVVALEDLYGGWDGLAEGVALLARTVLEPLAGGRAAAVPRYDWHAREWAAPWTLEPPAELIVEGVGAGASALAPHVSVLVWIELDEAARRERALHLRGDEDVYASHWERWAAQEDRFFRRERPWERAAYVLVPGP